MKYEQISIENSTPLQKTTMEKVEYVFENVLFASRWLMAPFYLLMVVALGVLLLKFCQELVHIVSHAVSMTEASAILGVLSLIDISLAGNLLLMVLFSGYENFVSKMDVGHHQDRPAWMGTIDFSGLKLKLIASIVAISGIHLLKSFMALATGPVTPAQETQITWMVVLHFAFVISGVLLALMDKIIATTHALEKH